MRINKSSLTSLLFLVALAIPALLPGQINNFEFVQYDTSYSGDDFFIVLEGDIFSLTNTEQSITVTKVEHDRPVAWTVFFCAGPACLPDLVESFTFSLAANDTGYFSVEAYPNATQGIGTWTFFAVDSSTMEVDSVNVLMEVIATTAIDDVITPASFNLSYIYPNPTNAWINFDLDVEYSGSYQLILYSLDGRQIISRAYNLRPGKNKLQWSVEDLPSGNYIITAVTEDRHISRQISVIK